MSNVMILIVMCYDNWSICHTNCVVKTVSCFEDLIKKGQGQGALRYSPYSISSHILRPHLG